MWNKTIEKKPDNPLDVIGYNYKWKQPLYNPKGTNVCFLDNFGKWVVSMWDKNSDKRIDLEEGEYVEYGLIEAPTHWTEKPEPPTD